MEINQQVFNDLFSNFPYYLCGFTFGALIIRGVVGVVWDFILGAFRG